MKYKGHFQIVNSATEVHKCLVGKGKTIKKVIMEGTISTTFTVNGKINFGLLLKDETPTDYTQFERIIEKYFLGSVGGNEAHAGVMNIQVIFDCEDLDIVSEENYVYLRVANSSGAGIVLLVIVIYD